MRTGRLSNEDMDFIEKNWKTMTVTDIARSLDRSIPSIKNFIDNKIKKTSSSGLSKELKAEFDVTTRAYWPDIKLQLEDNEIPLFIYHWENTISQFKDDVLPTEEMQIVDMVTKTILMNRCLKTQKENKKQIIALEAAILQETSKDISERDMKLFQELMTNLSFLRQAEQTSSKDYQSLSASKNSLLEKLKATRKDRVKDVESSRQTFVGILSNLLQNKELRKEWGIHIEKMRIASEIEKARISEYHTYEDGNIDQPLLTPENIKEDNALR